MSRSIRVAKIDYQPDLHHARAAIPLGVIVVDMGPQSTRWVIIGREPRRDSVPIEMKTVGRLGMAQLNGWVTGIARDLFEALDKKQDPVEHLAMRWRWNVHVSGVESVGEKPEGTLPQIAAALYTRHVRQPAPQSVIEKPTSTEPIFGDWSLAEVEYAASA